jgi:predicted acyltransferase
MLGVVYWLVDVRGWIRWSFFFRVIGANAIAIYILQWAWSFPALSKKILGGVAGLMPEVWGVVILQLGAIALRWLVLHFLYRRKIFVKV